MGAPPIDVRLAGHRFGLEARRVDVGAPLRDDRRSVEQLLDRADDAGLVEAELRDVRVLLEEQAAVVVAHLRVRVLDALLKVAAVVVIHAGPELGVDLLRQDFVLRRRDRAPQHHEPLRLVLPALLRRQGRWRRGRWRRLRLHGGGRLRRGWMRTRRSRGATRPQMPRQRGEDGVGLPCHLAC